jgi:predicted MFS family arabinose efflux permease
LIRTIARTYRAAYSGLSRELWLLSLVLLVNRAGGMVLPFITLYLTHERGLSVAVAGRILSLYGLGALVGSFIGGWLSDRIGATRTQQVSLIASGFGYLWLSVLEGLFQISLAVFLLSIAVESFRPAVMADTAQRAPAAARVRAFALLRLAANLGVGLGPAVGGYLALYDYHWLFVADAASCWAAFLLLTLTLEVSTAGADAKRQTISDPSPWSDRPFLLLMVLVVVIAAVFFQFLGTLPLYFRQVRGFPVDTIGLLLAFNPLLIVLFEMVLIHWAERRDRMYLVGLGAFLICAGLALMPLGGSLVYVMLTIAVWTLGEMLALPLINAVVTERAGPGSQGRYMGLYTMAFSAAFVFAPAFGMTVYERLGPNALWFGIGALGPPLWIWAIALDRAFRRSRPGGQPSGPGLTP